MDAFANLAQSQTQMTAWGVKAENDEGKDSLPWKHGIKKQRRPKTVARRKSNLLSDMLFLAKEVLKENSVNVDVSNEKIKPTMMYLKTCFVEN